MRKIFKYFLILSITAGIFLLGALFMIDGMIGSTIEKHLSEMTGTPVTVERVDLSILSGSGSIIGLKVGNPPGFSSKPALEMGEISFLGAEVSIFSKLIEVRRVEANSTRVSLEKNQSGAVNLELLSRTLRSREKGEKQAEGPGSGWSFSLKVGEFILNEGRIDVSGFGQDPGQMATPSIQLQDLGGSAGASPEIVGKEILAGIFSGMVREFVQSGIEQWIEENDTIPDPIKDLINRGLKAIN